MAGDGVLFGHLHACKRWVLAVPLNRSPPPACRQLRASRRMDMPSAHHILAADRRVFSIYLHDTRTCTAAVCRDQKGSGRITQPRSLVLAASAASCRWAAIRRAAPMPPAYCFTVCFLNSARSPILYVRSCALEAGGCRRLPRDTSTIVNPSVRACPGLTPVISVKAAFGNCTRPCLFSQRPPRPCHPQQRDPLGLVFEPICTRSKLLNFLFATCGKKLCCLCSSRTQKSI